MQCRRVIKKQGVKKIIDKNQEQIIQREYPQDSPKVKILKITLFFFGMDQNSGNQKTRKNKKQGNAC